MDSLKSTESIAHIPPLSENELLVGTDEDIQNVPETWEWYSQIFNVYDREILCQEVWKQSITKMVKKYKSSDIAIHKVCKSLTYVSCSVLGKEKREGNQYPSQHHYLWKIIQSIREHEKDENANRTI